MEHSLINNIHVIWTAPRGNLSDIIRDFKTFTSKAMFESMKAEPESRKEWLEFMFRVFANKINANENFKIWSGDNHAEAIYTSDFLLDKFHYIHQNPVWAGIVADAVDYLYSSANIYAGQKSV